MLTPLPKNVFQFMEWPWSKIEPYYQDLISTDISTSNVHPWLEDWSRLGELLYETYERLMIATTVNTADDAAKLRFDSFLDEVFPHSQSADQLLKEKLLKSGLCPSGFKIPLLNMRAEANIFSEANLPLLTQELKLSNEYDKIFGAQTTTWEGEEVTLTQLEAVLLDTDREKREHAWRLIAERRLADRETTNKLWSEFMNVRRQITENSNLADFREYRWQKLHRFDYTPQDCINFHDAIEEVVVPAANRLYERRRQRLGVDTLRPWDINSDPLGRPPLLPFKNVDELESKVKAIFDQVDPQFGVYFSIMQQEGLLDLDNRKGKAPGGYCTDLPVNRRPFIFMNAVGTHEDVQTLLHEGGHAFHLFESADLPYLQQLQVNHEFAEVASMSMELLSGPYLAADKGGFYTPQNAARARSQYLEEAICFWPYMAVVDAFQHWVYENPNEASKPDNCDIKWTELWNRYMPGEDWSDLDQEKMTGWQRKSHIHIDPFYYIEYGIAMLGAFQVWHNAIEDQAGAVADYRRALSLGATAPLPQLFTTAGIKFSFDAETLQKAVDLAERTITELDAISNDQR